jgi:hypothetical protein
MVQHGSGWELETKRSKRGYGEAQMPPMREGQRIPSIVEMPRNAELKRGAPEQQWPQINEEIAFRKIL